MLPWTLPLFLLPSICAIGYPQYECGDHGRFEYCIDGVPGCVIGCHCHPGYYFDTETKICEPNSKLVQEYRRLYLPEPTRVQVPLTQADADKIDLPTPTTTGPLETHVDAIAKNTDDLGDWLYNQFFKTIENQVINSTNNDKTLARRSDTVENRTKKTRKKNKKSSKRIKIKKKGLRRKLLRITNDDSLFDTDSDSDETSHSGSSSDSDSDTTVENDKEYHQHNDKEHGHRKILVINKKPKPPLPSFIFLPNLETPFYPPIGLAPPPAIPMYPVVPVPPMPVFPYPPGPNQDKLSSTVSPTTTAQTQTPQTEDKDETTHKKDEKENEDDSKKIDGDKEENNKMDGDDHKDNEKDSDDNPQSVARKQHAKKSERQKMLKQMRKKLRFPPFNKAGSPTSRRNPTSKTQLQYPDSSLYDELTTQDTPFTNSRIKPPDFVPSENVGFKYLSQLIHKIDPNMTQVDLNKNINRIQNLQSRTFVNNKYAQRPEQYQTEVFQRYQYRPELNQLTQNLNGGVMTKQNEPDSYYANLGQQIASLIRKIDTVGERQVNIDIPPTQVTPIQPVFNGNNYASRSYWERSVRSPLNYFRPPTNEIQRNYENLFNLENKVETYATTEHALSLHEIENVIFLMDKAKSKFQDKIKNLKSNRIAKEHSTNAWISNKQHHENFNINLLPRQSDLLNSEKRNLEFVKEPVTKKMYTKTLDNKLLKIPKNDRRPGISKEIINNNNLHLGIRGILMNNLRNVIHDVISIRSKDESQFNRPNNSSISIEGNINKNNSNEFEQLPKIYPFFSEQVLPYISNIKRHSAKQSYTGRIYHQLTPLLHNLRNNKYLRNRNKYGSNEIKPFVLSNTVGFEKYRPSYFHHEFHHFDYFD